MNLKSRFISYFALLFICAICARGLFRNTPLAGHDATAYPITQQQFHENIREGVLFPRWSPDMRYGYGHVKLQYRPPLLHYLAEPWLFLSNDIFLSLHIALIIIVFIAGFGAFQFCRLFLAPRHALVAAAAYITANYFIADIYLRGAYYEIVADAFMPWLLWAQSTMFLRNKEASRQRTVAFCVGSISWACVICGHPQIAVFLIPLIISLGIYCYLRTRDSIALSLNALALIIGILLAAPYLFVAYRELAWVRMQLFDLGLQHYGRHFITLKQIFTETWPDQYQLHTGVLDYLNRPIHREVRGLNYWATIVLILTPFFWFFRNKGDGRTYRLSLFFWFWGLVSIVMSLSVSHGIWRIIPLLHTFNFPWRSLNITILCLAPLTGLLLARLERQFREIRVRKRLLVTIVIGIMLIEAWPHSIGWDGPKWLNVEFLSTKSIRNSDGVPQHFYTPKWVKTYPKHPAQQSTVIREGDASAELTQRGATFWNLRINAKTPATIILAHHYYPGWRLHGLDNAPIDAKPNSEGLMEFEIPQGEHKATLKFDLTSDRKLAYWLFGAGLLSLFTIAILMTRWKKQTGEVA